MALRTYKYLEPESERTDNDQKAFREDGRNYGDRAEVRYGEEWEEVFNGNEGISREEAYPKTSE